MKGSDQPGQGLGGGLCRHILSVFLLPFFLFCGSALAQPPLSSLPAIAPQPAFSADKVLVAFHPGVSAQAQAAAHGAAGGQVEQILDAVGVQVVRVAPGRVMSAVAQYRANPRVQAADPNYRRLLYRPVTREGAEPDLGITNLFDEQWGLHNSGQSFGVATHPLTGELIIPAYTGSPDADIDAVEGWAISTGSSGVNIAVLDSGVSCLHVDLAGKCVENRIFVSPPSLTTLDDQLAHGTHVAALAAARTDNGKGIAGVARHAGIGALKVCYEQLFMWVYLVGVCEDADVISAINHAVTSSAPVYHVINMSLAGPDYSATFESAVDSAWAAGLVLVAGAGNDYLPARRYPAAYANVIGVAATDQHDNLAAFSSFYPGSASYDPVQNWVSVAAPGHLMWSAVPGVLCQIAEDHPEGCYDVKSGTSMATPIVAGMAAVLIGADPAATNGEIRARIEGSADQIGALGQNMLAWTQFGRVNLARALAGSEPPPPPPPAGSSVHIGDLDGSSSNGGGTWTAQVFVEVHQPDGVTDQPVVGATVDYQWSDGTSGSCTAPCDVSKSGIRKRDASITFTVTWVTFGTDSYDAGSNHDPDGDSDGTAITLLKP